MSGIVGRWEGGNRYENRGRENYGKGWRGRGGRGAVGTRNWTRQGGSVLEEGRRLPTRVLFLLLRSFILCLFPLISVVAVKRLLVLLSLFSLMPSLLIMIFLLLLFLVLLPLLLLLRCCCW